MNMEKQKAPAQQAQSSEGSPIKARVLPHNNYGKRGPGTIVEVSAAELKRCKHALISLEEEARQRAEAEKPLPPTPEQNMFRSLKRGLVKAAETQKASQARAMKERLELVK